MCIILIASQDRIPSEDLYSSYVSNADGIGIAWISGKEGKKGIVQFVKGISIGEVKKLAARLPLPYVVHFRMDSIGIVSPQLCHPFPMVPGAPVKLKGKNDTLFFHNGHWMDWRESWLTSAQVQPKHFQDGTDWSDTRLMAHIAGVIGEGAIGALANRAGKIAIVTPTGVVRWGTWYEKKWGYASATIVRAGLFNHYGRGDEWEDGWSGYNSTFNKHKSLSRNTTTHKAGTELWDYTCDDAEGKAIQTMKEIRAIAGGGE